MLLLGIVLTVVGCEGPQSALAPAGKSAEQLANLFWVMATGGSVVWAVVVGVGVYSLLRPETGNPRKAAIYIIGGGVVFPTILLTALLCYGLAILPAQVATAPADSLQIKVIGHQWWWEVRYKLSDGRIVETANEIRLPVDEPVQFLLESSDVIHAFWIPSLGGKVDMIPGRQTRLALHPTKTGVYRGVCAEYCGASHSLMSFFVEVHERSDFDQWLRAQAEPARPPSGPLPARGSELFTMHGCGACHRVEGTPATGGVGPDLTHVGGRLSLAAGALANDADDFEAWIRDPKAIKPAAKMPHFSMLPPEEIEALAAYLDSLQ